MNEPEQDNSKQPELLEQPILWGFAKFTPIGGQMRFRLQWKRICVALLVALFLLWGMKSAAIFCFFKYSRGYDKIAVADAITFPLSRGKIAHDFGEIQLAQARTALETNDLQKALFLLRTGLGRSPSNRDARIAYANILRELGEEEITLELYRGGLNYHADDAIYMQSYLQVLFDYRKDADIAAIAQERLKAAPDRSTNTEKVIALNYAREEATNGRYKEALTQIDKYGLNNTIEGCLLLAEIHWRYGDKSVAVTILDRFINQHPQNKPEAIYRTLYRYLVELGRNREASLCALNHVNNAHESAAARREMIECFAHDGKTERAAAEIRNYLHDFGNDKSALLLIMDYALASGNLPLAKDAYARMAENGGTLALNDIMLTDVCNVTGNALETIRNCDIMTIDGPFWMRKLKDHVTYLRAATSHALGRQERLVAIFMESLLNSDTLDANNMLEIAGRMRQRGMDTNALTLLKRARKMAPRDERILGMIVQIQIDDAIDEGFVKDVDELLALRLPDRDLLKSIRARLTSDSFIFDKNRDAVLAKTDDTIAGMNIVLESRPR